MVNQDAIHSNTRTLWHSDLSPLIKDQYRLSMILRNLEKVKPNKNCNTEAMQII